MQQWYSSQVCSCCLEKVSPMALESSFVQAVIPHFDGHYGHWSMLMENFLWSNEYWPIVEAGIKELAEGETLTNAKKVEFKVRKLKDLKAKNYLFHIVDYPILETILAKELPRIYRIPWRKKYQGSTRVKRAQLQALRRDFETLQMNERESVTCYYARIMKIYNRM